MRIKMHIRKLHKLYIDDTSIYINSQLHKDVFNWNAHTPLFTFKVIWHMGWVIFLRKAKNHFQNYTSLTPYDGNYFNERS